MSCPFPWLRLEGARAKVRGDHCQIAEQMAVASAAEGTWRACRQGGAIDFAGVGLRQANVKNKFGRNHVGWQFGTQKIAKVALKLRRRFRRGYMRNQTAGDNAIHYRGAAGFDDIRMAGLGCTRPLRAQLGNHQSALADRRGQEILAHRIRSSAQGRRFDTSGLRPREMGLE